MSDPVFGPNNEQTPKSGKPHKCCVCEMRSVYWGPKTNRWFCLVHWLENYNDA